MNPLLRVAGPERLPAQPPTRTPPRAVFAVASLLIADAIRRVPTLSTRRWGRTQNATVHKVVTGHVAPCLPLLICSQEHLERATTREESAAWYQVLDTLREEYAAREDAKFGVAAPLSLAEASCREERINGDVNVLQHEVLRAPTPGVVARLRAKVREQVAALDALLIAARHHDSQHARQSWT